MLRKRENSSGHLFLVQPLVVRHSAGLVVVVLAIVRIGMTSDSGIGSTRDDEHSVSLVAGARSRVVDEDITRDDVGWGLLVVSTSPGPSVLPRKAVSEVLGTDLLLAARISTARSTLVQGGVATSKKALRDEVGTVTMVAAIVTVFIAVVGPWSAALVARGALVVGLVPPGLGVGDSLVTVVGRDTSSECKKSNNSLHV